MCILSFAQRFPNCWMLKVFMLLFYKYLCNGQYHRGLCVCMLWTTSPRYLRACCGFTACLSPPLEYENEISLVTCISWAGYGRSDGCHFGDWVIKGLWLLPCFFLGHVFWVRQLTCYRMLKQSCGEVHGVTSLQPGKWVIWEVNPLASDKPSDNRVNNSQLTTSWITRLWLQAHMDQWVNQQWSLYHQLSRSIWTLTPCALQECSVHCGADGEEP